MDDAHVTACDKSAALSQSAYILYYSLEGALEGVLGEGLRPPSRLTPHTPWSLNPPAPGSLWEMPAAELLGPRCPQGTQRSNESA